MSGSQIKHGMSGKAQHVRASDKARHVSVCVRGATQRVPALSGACTVKCMRCRVHALSGACTVGCMHALSGACMHCRVHALSGACTVGYMHCRVHALSGACTIGRMHCRVHGTMPKLSTSKGDVMWLKMWISWFEIVPAF